MQLTAPEAISGTPAYMAPEMASGEPVDSRADLYALGCVGYFLVTGQRIFEGTHPMQVVLQHLRSEPVPPSERIGRPVPPALERLLLHCLAKNPADRPPRRRRAGRGTRLGRGGRMDPGRRAALVGVFVHPGTRRRAAHVAAFAHSARGRPGGQPR